MADCSFFFFRLDEVMRLLSEADEGRLLGVILPSASTSAPSCGSTSPHAFPSHHRGSRASASTSSSTPPRPRALVHPRTSVGCEELWTFDRRNLDSAVASPALILRSGLLPSSSPFQCDTSRFPIAAARRGDAEAHVETRAFEPMETLRCAIDHTARASAQPPTRRHPNLTCPRRATEEGDGARGCESVVNLGVRCEGGGKRIPCEYSRVRGWRGAGPASSRRMRIFGAGGWDRGLR